MSDTEYKIGDTVSYWRGIKSGTRDGIGKIYALDTIGNTAVAWIENCRGGCVALTHLERVKP